MSLQIDILPVQRRVRRAGLAAVLSLVLPGLGQIYCRQDNKGVFLAGMALFGHWATGGMSSLLLCPAISLDAFMIARKINRGGSVQRWEFFPAIKGLRSLPPRIILLAIIGMIATLAVVHVVWFASDYHPNR
jgi:TM2 domain-containing membrane protein YozV